MTLVLTIFLLVFLTELVSWIGKSVLLEIVRRHSLACVMDIMVNATSRITRLMQVTCDYSMPLPLPISES
jgi:hypothetical protein